MRSFTAYCEAQENVQFAEKLNVLCEQIIQSNLSFEEFWAYSALPMLQEGKYESVEDLLSEAGFFKDFKSSRLNPMNLVNKGTHWFGKGPDPFQQGMNTMQAQNVAGNMAAADQGVGDPVKAMKQSRAAIDSRQGGIDQLVGNIKQKFSQAMQQFLKSSSDDAMRSGDKFAYAVAQKFYNKLMQVVQPILDQYKLNVKTGSSPEHDQMMQNYNAGKAGMQQQRMDDLKNRYGSQRPVQNAQNTTPAPAV